MYSYDGDGELSSIVDSVGGTQTYGYDGLNRQTRVTPPGAAAVTVTFRIEVNVTGFWHLDGTNCVKCEAGSDFRDRRNACRYCRYHHSNSRSNRSLRLTPELFTVGEQSWPNSYRWQLAG